jgi:hypothetical protein
MTSSAPLRRRGFCSRPGDEDGGGLETEGDSFVGRLALGSPGDNSPSGFWVSIIVHKTEHQQLHGKMANKLTQINK